MWLGTLSKNSPIQVIGAGISGLLVGHYLKKAGLDFKIWDLSNRSGGKIHSYHNKFGLVETAANAIILDQNVKDLLTDLNLVPLEATKKLKRWVDHNGQWYIHYRLAFRIFTCLFLKGFKQACYQHNDKVVFLDKFFTPLMGKAWSVQFLSAICRGVFSKNSYELTLDAFFNADFLATLGKEKLNFFQFFYRFIAYKKKHKSSGSVSFKQGMQELIDGLTLELKDHLHLNANIESISSTIALGNTLFCTPPHQTSSLLQVTHPQLADKFKHIPMVSLQSMTVFTKKPFIKLENSFGVLLTPSCTQPFFGILAPSEIFPHRTKKPDQYCYTLIGEMTDSTTVLESFYEYAQLNKTDILEHVLHQWPSAIPLYNDQRINLINEIKMNLDQNENLAFFGNYILSVGLKDLVSGAKNLVKSMMNLSAH